MDSTFDQTRHGNDPRPLSALSIVLQDQQERWQLGECPVAEDYLNQHASLREDSKNAIALIYHEVVLRERRGEHPTLAEYETRFPQWAGDLKAQFEIHSALSILLPLPPVQTPGMPAPPPGYEILEILGRGGMAVVYKARQIALGRMVALKMIMRGDEAQPQDLARFQAEARAIASLKHANIVQIHEVIEHEGRLFLALEYVDGGNLAQRIRGAPMSSTVAARLVEDLADAMHFVHQQGIIHRDLKPANILLHVADASGDGPAHHGDGVAAPAVVPKITDFGLAKWLWSERESRTRTGEVLGTPSYMAPEQLEGPRERIGPAADVYGLGTILYEMLTGRPPFLGSTPLATLQQVRDAEPVSPSTLQPGCPRDLATIVLKCLEKAPARRYESAAALADDLRRFRDGRSITARPASAREHLIKWIRRQPAVASLIAAVVLLTYGGGALVTYLWLTNAAALDDAKKARSNAAAALDDANDARSKTILALKESDKQRLQAEDALAEKLLVLAQYDFSQNKLDEVRNHLNAVPERHRGDIWRNLFRHISALRSKLQVDNKVISLLFSPDNRLLVIHTHGEKDNIILWDHAANKVVRKFTAPFGCMGLYFGADNNKLSVVELTQPEDMNTKEIIVHRFPIDGSPADPPVRSFPANHSPRIFQDSGLIATSLLELRKVTTEIVIWDPDKGVLYRRTLVRAQSNVDISADGKQLALTITPLPGQTYRCEIISLKDGALIRQYEGKLTNSVQMSPDLRSFTTTAYSGGQTQATIKVYDSVTQKLKWVSNWGRIYLPAYSGDGARVCVVDGEKRVVILDAESGKEILGLRGHQGVIGPVRLNRDGRLAASADYTNEVRLWAIDDGK